MGSSRPAGSGDGDSGDDCEHEIHARWTLRLLAGSFLDLALVYAFLCAAAAASAASRALAVVGLRLPCTCARPHLGCLLSFLSRYPSQALSFVVFSVLSRYPFPHIQRDSQEEADLRQVAEEEAEARAALQRELEKERSAAASAAEEAMAMILRLQKEKSALEIEARQQRRTDEERLAFLEDEVEELRDIVLHREREARSLRKEVDAYRRLLGVDGGSTAGYGDEEELAHNAILDCEPSSSKLVKKDEENEGIDSRFSFQTAFSREDLVSPVHVDDILGADTDDLAYEPICKAPLIKSKLEVDYSDDDGTDTVEILPLSVQSRAELAQNSEQCRLGEGDVAAGTEATMEGLPSDEFQGEHCGDIIKICHGVAGIENDAHVYDVHVVDDTGFLRDDTKTKVACLISRKVHMQSSPDATMQVERLQNRIAADDLLRKSLNIIKGAQEKLRSAASEREWSLQLQLLEEVADQLEEIKNAAEAGQHIQGAASKNSKNS